MAKKIAGNKKKFSELRQDLVSGEWVVIATSRARRPHALKYGREKFNQPKNTCPFEDPQKSGHTEPILILNQKSGKDWFLQVIPNKFPAFIPGPCPEIRHLGLYQEQDGIGFHDLIVTRYHDKQIAQFSQEEVEKVLWAYQTRYLAIKDDDCVKYISIFHNHGREAGASISHPHSQFIALPVIPPDVSQSLDGSKKYYNKFKRCVHCDMLKQELDFGGRLVYQNNFAVAYCPYASRIAYEIRVYPKVHMPRFEDLSNLQRRYLAEVFRVALYKIYKGLKDPAYNFFIHTAPPKESKEYNHYHWHLEIIPKTAIWAGFEIGTGIDISTVSPTPAAEFLRKVK